MNDPAWWALTVLTWILIVVSFALTVRTRRILKESEKRLKDVQGTLDARS